MKDIRRMFTDKEKEAIKQAVAGAESKTSAEIIPAITSSSGRYDRGEDIFGVLTGLIFVAAAWQFQDIRFIAGDWGAYPVLSLNLFHVIVISAAGFITGTCAAAWFPCLKLPFLTKKEIDEEIERGAAAAFYRCRVRGTTGSTGVLIYISLFERRVRVLPDNSIKERFAQADWEKICDVVTEGMRKGSPAESLCAAIIMCGEMLASRFPAQPGDVNELGNELRILD